MDELILPGEESRVRDAAPVQASEPEFDFLIPGDDPVNVRASAAVRSAVVIDPDKAAKVKSLATVTGLPAPTVERNLDAVEQQQKLKEIQELMVTSPILARQMTDPEFAKLAHDDAQSLSMIERVVKTIKESYLGASAISGTYALTGAAATLASEVLPGASEADIAALAKSDPAEYNRLMNHSAGTFLLRLARSQQDASERAIERMSPTAKSEFGDLKYGTLEPGKSAWYSPTKLTGDLVQSLPSTLALMLSAYVTKGAGRTAYTETLATTGSRELAQAAGVKAASETMARVGAASEGAVGYAQQYNATRASAELELAKHLKDSPDYKALLEEGYAPEVAMTMIAIDTARQSGLSAGVVDALTNLIGGRVLGKIIGEGGSVVPRVAKGAGTEAATEFVQSGGEQFVENLAVQQHIDPNKPLGDDVFESALQGLAVGSLSGGAASGFFGRQDKANTADRDAETIAELTKAVAATKLFERDPQSVKEFVDAAAQAGPVKEVWIDTQILTATLEQAGIDQATFATMMPTVAVQMSDPLSTIGDVRIPLGELVTALPGTPLEKPLIQHLRVSNNAPSQAEAKEFYQKQADEFKAQAEKILEDKATDTVFTKSAAVVEADLLSQLKTANRFTADVNSAYAKLVSAFYTTLAAKKGVTPEQMYAKYPLRIQAEAVAGEKVMDQPRSPMNPTVDDIHTLADDNNITWDNDPAFMDLTEQVTGKRHLDELNPQERKLLYHHIANAKQGAQSERQTARDDLDFTDSLREPQKLYTTVSGGTPEESWRTATRIRRSDGQPTPIFRGAGRPLSAKDFEPAAFGVNTSNPSSGVGVWFTVNADEARHWGEVEDFHLDIRNPLIFKNDDFPGFDSVEDATKWREKQRKLGYDGILLNYTHVGGHIHLVAFAPEQVVYTEPPVGAMFQQGPRPSSDRGHKREMATGRYVGAPDWVGSSPQAIASMRAKLRSLARDGEAGRYWYENSSRAILDLVGGDKVEAEKIVALIAIYSPNATVPANTAMALTAYYQFQAGEEIKAGLGAGNEKALELLRDGKMWSGIKTNAFYSNLMEEIDPSKNEADASTMDMWMAIAFDYGSNKLDQGPKQIFMQREIQALAEEMGWRPHQLQAAIWTGIKARVDAIRDELKAADIKAGNIIDVEKNGKTVQKRVKEYEHFKLAHKMGMAHDLQPDDVGLAKYDFSDAIRGRLVQMSWEATPGRGSGVLPQLLTAPLAVKQAYLIEVQKILAPDGVDAISKMVGLPQGQTMLGFSAWEGDIGAGAQSFFTVPIAGAGPQRAVKTVAREMLSAAAAIRGYVLSQDMVAWHHPVWVGSELHDNGLDVQTKRPLTYGEMQVLYDALIAKFNTEDIAPAYTDSGVRILNFLKGLGNKQFQTGVQEVLKSLPEDFGGGPGESFGYRSDGDYVKNDWTKDTQGENYTQAISGRSPDLLRRAEVLRADVQALNTRFAAEQGWGEGATYAQEAVGSEAFKKWFGDSKVVDDSGKPLVVYHGTTTDNEGVFLPDAGVSYFSPDPAFASRWARMDRLRSHPQAESPPHVVPVYLSLQNPFDFRKAEHRKLAEQWLRNNASDSIPFGDLKSLRSTLKEGHFSVVEDEELIQMMQDKGFDGFLVREAEGSDNINYGVFDNRKIKSAIGNRGTFDPASPNILEQQPAPVQAIIDDGVKRFSVAMSKYHVSEFESLQALDNGRARNAFDKIETGIRQRLREAGVSDVRVNGTSPIDSVMSDIEALARGSKTLRQPAGWDVAETGDPSSPDPLKPGKGSRGTISFGEDITKTPTVITLLQNADLSTFLHESGHFYLEVLADMASQPDAPIEIVQDMQKLLDWFGVPDLQTWRAMSLTDKRPLHEQLARGFEAYLFEGKSPSLELSSLFGRLRDWMLNVYKSILELTVNISPEVRGVFDRMLATDEQIKLAEIARGYTPMFKTPEEAAKYGVDWAAYQEQGQDATREGVEQLQTASLRDMRWLSGARSRKLKELQRAAAGKRKAVEAEVTREVNAQPIYIAERGLRTGWKQDDGSTINLKFNTATLAAQYPASMVDQPDMSKLYGMTNAKTGLHPDQVAELTGFSSGDELVRKLTTLEPRESVIEGMTDQRMLERYGDLSDPQSLERATDAAIHNEARIRFVATELRALAKATGQKNILLRAAKEFAAVLIARKRIREIRPAQYAASEARSAAAAMKALGAGKLIQAAIEKRNQIVHHYAERAAADALTEVEKGVAYLKRVGDSETIDADYHQQIAALLDRFDLRALTNKEADRRTSLLQWAEAQRELGFEPAIDEALLNEASRKPYREMTLEEFRGLRDAVKNIEHLGRLKHRLLTAKDEREFAAIVAEARNVIIGNAKRKIPVQLERNSWTTKMKDGTAQFFALHRKFASMIHEMDGYVDGGKLWSLFVRPMNAAGDAEAVMREQATIRFTKLMKNLKGKFTTKVFIPEIDNSLSREGRIMVALNTGNAGNLQRLMDGDHWTGAQVTAIVNTLTKEEMDFVQSVWDFVGEYRAEVGAQQKRLTGLEPEWVEATPVITRHGTYRGGYLPAKYDSSRSTRSLQDEAATGIMEQWRAARGRPTTRATFVKARAAEVVDRPLRKDFGVLTQHITEVTHRLAWEDYLIDAKRLLNAGGIDNAIRDHYGPEVLQALRKTIEDVAAGEVMPQNVFERGANWLRTGTTIAFLGWRVTTSLMQPLGLTQSMVRIGPIWVARGIGQWIGDAAHMENTAANIYAKSSFMRLRGKTMQREVSEIRNKVSGKSSAIEATFFYLIQKMQLVADIPTWLGMYTKAVEGGADEKTAVAQADQAVLDAQGSGQLKDLAGIQRGGDYAKLFTNFYSFFNTTYNNTSMAWGRTKFTNPLSVGRLAVDMLLLYTVPAVLATLMKTALHWDWDDEEKLARKLIADQLTYMLGTMVGLRELAGAAQTFVGLPGDYQGPASVRFFAEVAKLGTQTAQGEVDEAALKALDNVGGILFHYPAGQINATASGLWAWANGETENPGALVVGEAAK